MSLSFLFTAFLVCLSPGTGVIYTLAIGLGQGKRAAVWAALGCTFGIVPHLFAAAFGLSAVLHSSALLFAAVKWLGVAYLLWLAWGALKSEGGVGMAEAQPFEMRGLRIAKRGALINILNPKLSLFFLALLPPFLSGAPETATLELLALGAVFMVITFVVFVGYGAFAGQARQFILGSKRAMLWLNRSFAAVFGILATRLAFETR